MNRLADVLDALPQMGVPALRVIWEERFGEPPPVRAAVLLRLALAERLQKEAYGCDRGLERQLRGLVSRYRPGRKPRVEASTYKAGSLLVREWEGVRHEVQVVEGAYLWNGERHASLSKIARSITGVRWNGPRFFGLRDKAA